MEREAMSSAIFRRRLMIDGVDCKEAKGNQSAALDHIHEYYKKALHRLPPELIPSLLDAGFCFGFLDPVSNIIANTVSQELHKRRKRKRSRAGSTANNKRKEKESQRLKITAISKIVVESSKNIWLVPRLSDRSNTLLRSSSIAARSLRGLVTFLTSYFRYLTTWDALRYLRLSNAHLLVAVRLIQEDRGTHSFPIHGPTAETALRCAAISAFHPTVDILVSRSFSLASCVDKASSLLGTQGSISHTTVKALSKLFTSTKDQWKPIRHAVSSMQHTKREAALVEVGLEISLKMVLLDKIHVLYLKAISCIPKHDLCSRYHRGLLKAGHCYGPLDPVTNIILNTILYDTMFPPKQEFEVEMICTKSLARIEFLSLCGLVAYTCVRFPAYSVYEAMKYLLLCNVRLDRVIEKGYDGDIPFSESVAYDTASRAARHPSPTALVEFATTLMPQVGETLRSTLEVKQVLSSRDVRAISRTLSQKFQPAESLEPVEKLSKNASTIISKHQDNFMACQSTTVRKVEAALLRYAKEAGQEYELHFICDVNSTIPEYGVCYCPCNYKYPVSHMNVWARRRGSQSADQVPTLFFIQCSDMDEDMESMPFLCCPIFDLSKDAGRCYYCEYKGSKIIHPSSEPYLGRCMKFEDMARGERTVNNLELAQYGQKHTLLDSTLEDEDSIYFDPARDVDFSVFINEVARDRVRLEKWRKKQHPGSVDYSWIEKMVYEKALACKKRSMSQI